MSNTKKQAQHFTQNTTFTASDIKKATGLSYRQLRFWDSKGVLPNNRSIDEGWRKYSPRDIFVITICLEIHKKFHIPLDSLVWVKKKLLKNNSNVLYRLIKNINNTGMTFYLMTDLKEILKIESDYEIQDLFEIGYFRSNRPQGYIFLKLNPLVNEMLSCFELPELKTSDKIYDEFNASDRESKANSPQELEVLRLIRERAYHNVVIQMKDKKIIQAYAEEELLQEGQSKLEKQILDALEKKDFQTLTIQVHNGRIVRLNRKSPIKF